MNESEFLQHTDRVFDALVDQLDAADLDLECVLMGNVLEIECPDGSKVVVNRHTPNRELWIAARHGGFHFAWRDGGWRDTRDGRDFYMVLGEAITLHTGSGCTVTAP